MKIDMFWVWMVVIGLTFLFQQNFTEKKTTWDVSYTYTTNSMDFIAYGQLSLTSPGSTLPWIAARKWAEDNLERENMVNEKPTVVILAIHKDTDERFFMPFWKHLNWYS